MKKNGFTLIELLAVIVVLSIIALIVTPVITGIIDDSRKEANKRSVEGYSQSIELAITRMQFEKGGQTVVTSNNGALPAEVSARVEAKGPTVVCDTIVIENDVVKSLSGCSVNGGDKITDTYSTTTGWPAE